MEKLNAQSLYRSLEQELILLDEERINTRSQLIKISLVYGLGVLAGVAAWAWGINVDQAPIYWSAGIAVVAALVGWIFQSNKIRKAFASSFKERVISKIIKKLDSSFVYKPDTIFHGYKDTFAGYLKNSKLFSSFSICNSEDSISGAVNDSRFEFREVRLETGGKNSKVVFRGIVITVTLKRPVSSPVYILPDSANQFRDSLWKMLSLKSGRGEVVLLDHEPFEKLFKVYADDGGLPATLLKRNALDGIVKIHEKVSAINPVRDAIRLAFADNSLTIAIHLNENLFEPRINKPLNDVAYFEKNVQYLTLFLGLIEDLKLSEL